MTAGPDRWIRWIRWTTIGCVALLALIAGTVSLVSPVPPTVIDVKSRYGMVLTSCHVARGSGAYTWRSSFSKTR
jgi:hypothetical protein